MNISNFRKEYKRNRLSEDNIFKNPFDQFEKWFSELLKEEVDEPNAMFVATSQDNIPNCRTVLLKEFSDKGFIFFTNYKSQKGIELDTNNHISLLFFWKELERQVRIRGNAKKIAEKLSEKYFRKRPFESQLASFISQQSKQVRDRNEILEKYEAAKLIYKDNEVPMNKDWGGYLVIPYYFEFWQGGLHRLHDRIVYSLDNGEWTISRLSP